MAWVFLYENLKNFERFSTHMSSLLPGDIARERERHRTCGLTGRIIMIWIFLHCLPVICKLTKDVKWPSSMYLWEREPCAVDKFFASYFEIVLFSGTTRYRFQPIIDRLVKNKWYVYIYIAKVKVTDIFSRGCGIHGNGQKEKKKKRKEKKRKRKRKKRQGKRQGTPSFCFSQS